MRFQKLSENKLKIFLSNDELPNSRSFDDFISDSSNAKHSFIDILEKAYDEVGFDSRDYKIKIDAATLKNGSFVFTVTKLVKIKSARKTAIPKKVTKNENTGFIIYKFDSFDDFYNFCGYIKSKKITDINLFAKTIELYLYNNLYYLMISEVNKSYPEASMFYSSITEFCKYYSSKELFVSVLKEKGKLIFNNNAIDICQKNL